MTFKPITLPQNKRIDAEQLLDEMKVAFADHLDSVDTGQKERGQSEIKIIVRLNRDATEADETTANTVLEAHTPAEKTRDEQRTIDNAETVKRVLARDFAAIRALPANARQDAILDALEDTQKLLKALFS